MKGNEESNISVFDIEDDAGVKVARVKKLDVVKLEYIGAESLSWQELFSGFDHLSAITFSSGINFIYNLLPMFKTVDIIFGCEEVISYSLNEIMAYQKNLIDRMRKAESKAKAYLLARMEVVSIVLCK